MSLYYRIRSLIKNLFRRDRAELELDAEMDSCLEQLIDAKISEGLTPDSARREALIDLGGVEQVKEQVRDVRAGMLLERVAQDIRYGLRMLRKNSGFAAVAVLTLALGIGANTAIFSVVDAVLLEMLPVRNPRQLLLLQWTAKDSHSMVQDLEGSNRKEPGGGFVCESFSYPAYEAMRIGSTSFSDVFAFTANTSAFNVQLDGKADSAACQSVSGNYFNGLGVQTALGRPILPGDDSPAAPPVAVISYSFWQSKVGADDSVVGKTIVVDNIALTVAGVAPPEFFGTEPGTSVDLWVPLHLYPRLLQAVGFSGPVQNGTDAGAAARAYWESPGTWWLVTMGRLKEGVTEGQARAELEVIFNQSVDAMIAAGNANTHSNRPVLRTSPGSKGLDQLRRQFSQPLLILVCAVGLVLLIACANVAGLLLARATARQREIAVRLSLGARRLRLIQQLLTESVLLAGMGGLLGLLFAKWFSELLVALASSGRHGFVLPFQVNVRVLLFTAGVALLTGILFGLAPAFSATHMSLTAALKEGSASSVLGSRRSRLVRVLVSTQVALSLLLLVGAGLFLQTLQKLQRVPLGFERQQMLLFSVAPGLNGYKGAPLAEYYREIQRRVAAIPGVNSVSFSKVGPIGYGESSTSVSIPGITPDKQGVGVHRHIVGPGYFDTLGIPILAGRVLDAHDDSDAPKVVVINEAVVREAFGIDNPLGKILRFGSADRDFEVVGVVGDAKYNSLRKSPPPTVYLSHLQALNAATDMTFEVRANGDPGVLAAALRREAADVDRNIPITQVETLVQAIDRTLLFERMFSRLTGFFGLLALVLVCVGLYGTMSYFVARQTNEIGIRMALGAHPVRIFQMVLTQGLKVTASGIVAGLAGAAAATRLISSSLYEVPALDPLTFVSVAALLVAVGLLACYVPARRAMKVDPLVALRYE